MKIKRFHAKTMRDALRQVREEQGPDSVILSKQRIGDGIEVIAAVDYDEALLHQSNQVLGARATGGASALQSRLAQSAGAVQDAETLNETAPSEPATPQPSVGSFFARVYSDVASGQEADEDDDQEATLNDLADDEPATESSFRSLFDATSTIATLPEPGLSSAPLLEEIATQLSALRQTVNEQYSELHWDDLQRREPHLAQVVQRLDGLGLSRSLVQSIVRALPPDLSADAAAAGQGTAAKDTVAKKAWRNAIGLLAKRIPVAAQDVCEEGGIFAVVGPTGAGKTTSIAKLAARFALENDPQMLGLITTDSFRIGAQEHLLRFGKILGVPVQVASTPEILRATLDQLADRKLILIDTAGFSLNDETMIENLENMTRHSPTVQTLLALPANLQTAALDQAIRTFDRLGLDGAIATKVDEATSLGGLLSTVIASNLSVCYVADGQRVPEDLKPASRFRAGFVSQAVSLARTFQTDRTPSSRCYPAQSAPEQSAAGKLHPINSDSRVASYG